MAKIFFPFADQPKKLPFLLDKTIRFPFTIDNLLYYCDISTEGITMYLHNGAISVDSLQMQMVLMEIKDILYLINGEIGQEGIPIVELSKKSFVTFKQYGRGLHTIGLLDPFTLGELDPFSFANIVGDSANWVVMENCLLEAISNVIVDFEHVGLQLQSASAIETCKRVLLEDIGVPMYSIGLGAQNAALLGQMDSYTLGGLDGKLITFRIFTDLSAKLNILIPAVNFTMCSVTTDGLATNITVVEE